jgi:NDP-sugar pyrophosphorylase family protein
MNANYPKKAMLFAAGLGTRLRPLTNDRPKALVPVEGIPLLELTLRKLKYYGFLEVVINIHHFGEKIINFLEQRRNFGLQIHLSDERDLLLNTGGGIKKAAQWLSQGPFLVHNTDIVSDLDLDELYRSHLSSDALATLAVRDRPSSRYLLFDDRQVLCGWRNERTGEVRMCRDCDAPAPLAFSGIHVLSPRIFEWMPDERVFSIIDVYLEAGKHKDIQAFRHDEGFWFDVGKIVELEKAAPYVRKLPLAPG